MSDKCADICSCSSWDEFTREVRVRRFAGPRIFRGQRDPEWKLASRWERWLLQMKGGNANRNVRELFSEGAFEKIRAGYLGRFKDLAIGLPGTEYGDLLENEWWALGRHHGLTTPLLDWTRSPHVAGYFAFLDLADFLNPGFREGTHHGGIAFGSGTVAVWELNLIDMEMSGEFEVFAATVGLAYRQNAQQGEFTRLTHDVHVDLEAYFVSRGLTAYLRKYEIPCQEMGKALCDLDLMNINPATMFPDLDGAAANANLWNTLQDLGWTAR